MTHNFNSEAMVMNTVNFKQLLEQGKVEFSYLTKNGEQRDAIGTLNMGMIPSNQVPKSGCEPHAGLTTYFDMNVNGWRCFRNENLKSVKGLID